MVGEIRRLEIPKEFEQLSIWSPGSAVGSLCIIIDSNDQGLFTVLCRCGILVVERGYLSKCLHS